jgi:hypothetical protein
MFEYCISLHNQGEYNFKNGNEVFEIILNIEDLTLSDNRRGIVFFNDIPSENTSWSRNIEM